MNVNNMKYKIAKSINKLGHIRYNVKEQFFFFFWITLKTFCDYDNAKSFYKKLTESFIEGKERSNKKNVYSERPNCCPAPQGIKIK